jgi:hypothetical protein
MTVLLILSRSPTADFTVSYHPVYEGLFLAVGCSDHVSEFFPVSSFVPDLTSGHMAYLI